MNKSTKQDGRPAMMFFPKDWLTDMGLQNCSIGARGLWFEMLCYMFFSPKRGYFLLPNGRAVNNKTITKLVRNITEKEIDEYIKELEENQVFSRLPNGTIYNRRMAEDTRKDLEIKSMRSMAGKKGMAKRWHNKVITPVIASEITNHKGIGNEVEVVSNNNDVNNQEEVKKKEVSKKEVIIFSFEKRKWEGITKEDFEGWQVSYPACDIKIELLRMTEWLLSNPTKKKKNYRRFITNWLTRSQDKGGTKGFSGYSPPERKSETPEEKATREKQEAEESEARYQKALEKWRGMSLEELRKHQVNLRKWGKIAKIPPVEVERDLAKIIKEKEKNV